MNKTKHFKRTAFNLSAKSMVSTLLLLIAMLMPQGAWAENFISEIKIGANSNQNTAKGYLKDYSYEPIERDLNYGNGDKSWYIYLGYKTDTDASKAITGIMIVSGAYLGDEYLEGGTKTLSYDGKTWYRSPAQSEADINNGAGGDDLTIFYTRDGNTVNGGKPLVSLSVAEETGLSGYTYAGLYKNGAFSANGSTNVGTKGAARYITYTTHTHAYTAAFNWATNGKSCTATVSCSCGDTHSNLACTVTDAPKSGAAATCTAMGWTTYTAKVTSNGKDFSGTKDVQDIAIVPHTFAANDAVHGVCTVCQHGFLRYTSKNNVVVTQKFTNSFYNGNTLLTVLSNANGVIEFNKPLTKIGKGAFENKTDLTSVTFPYTLTTIDELAFNGCTGLTATLTIPSSVTNIGEKAFVSTGISTVRNESATPQSYNNIFGTLVANKALLVPASAVQTYRAANGWKSFKSINCIEHDYSQMSTDTKYAIKAVTCTTAGTYYYSCYCGLNENNASHTFTVAALGHSYTSQTATDTYLKSAATCTADAVYYHKCSRCDSKGSTTWTNTGSALGHSYGAGSWSWADDGHSATCTRTCSRDANHKSSASVTLGNGITSEQQVAPNCTTKGTTRYTASATVEGTQYNATKDVVDIAALDHDYSQVVDANYLVSAATCIADAVYHEKCSRCTTHGAEWSATGTATGNHSYTNNTLTASPIEDGLYAYACDYGCGTHTDDHIIKDFYGEGHHLELTKDGEGNYSTSENIIINDPASFYSSVDFSSPVDFSAPSVTFNRYIINDGGMWSFIVPFDIPAAQAAQLGTFYQYRTHEGGKVYFDNIASVGEGIVRANTAYFFEPTTDFTSITVDDAEIKATTSMPDATNPSEPGLYGTYSQIDIPVGAYGYAMHKGQSTFVKAGTGNLLRSFRAYLWLGSGASMAKVLAIFGDYDVDAIELIGADDLDLNAPIYNLQGQRIVTPKKGEIYIQNGKKLMKK